MLSLFALAFFIGMSHALEADHVAAVSSMAAGQRSLKSILRTGAVWGMGHTLTLMGLVGAAMVLGWAISDDMAKWLEFTVGVMLVGLGGHIIFRIIRDRIHFHSHRHTDGATHFHAHSHAGEAVRTHNPAHHDHDHIGAPWRALIVGMMHGVAGSAALLVLAASTTDSPQMGIAYVLVFGLGSILGMAALSTLIAIPLTYTAKFLTWANRTIQVMTGTATFGLGVYVMYETQLQSLLGL